MGKARSLPSVLEYSLLMVAICIYALLYVVGKLDPYSPLFHVARYVDDYAEFCRLLDYSGKCGSGFIYTWLFSKTTPYSAMLVQVALVATMYITARRLVAYNPARAIPALLYITTPSTLFLGLLDHSGLIFLSPLIALAALLLLYGYMFKNAVKYLAAGLALYAFMAAHPAVFYASLPLSITAIADYVNGNITSQKIKSLAATVAISLLALAFIGPSNYDLPAVPVVALNGGALALSVVTGKRVRAPYRVASSTLIAILGVVLGAFIYLNKACIIVPYSTELSPLAILGLPGLLAIPAFLFAMKVQVDLKEKYLATSAVIASLLAPLSPLATPLAVALLALLGSTFLSRVLESTLKSPALTVPFKALLALVVAVSIAISALGPSIMQVTAIEKSSAFREVANLIRNYNFDTRLDVDLVELGDVIAQKVESTTSSRDILLIASVDYGYWLQGALMKRGVKAHTLTHHYGGVSGRSLLSTIMTSEWFVSKELLKNISHGFGASEVYLVIAGAYSVKNFVYSYVGVPFEYYIAGGQYPLLLHRAYGDLVNIPYYLEAANKTKGDYLLRVEGLDRRVEPLAWTSRGEEMLITQLYLLALKELGYFATFNAMVKAEPINASIKGFDYIYSMMFKVGEITTNYYGNYEIYYFIAVFRLTG